MLNTHGPCGDVRSLIIAVHCKGIAWTGVGYSAGCSDYRLTITTHNLRHEVGGIDPRATHRGAIPIQLVGAKRDAGRNDVANTWCGHAIELNRGTCGNDVCSQGDGIIRVLLGQEGAHREQVVNYTGTGSYNCFSITLNVPGDTDARSKVRGIFVVEGADILAHLFQPDRRLKVAKLIVGVARNPLEFIAQPQVQGHALRNAPIVLEESGEQILGHVADRVSGQDAGIAYRTGQKAFKCGRTWEGTIRSKYWTPPGSAEGTLIHFIDAEFATKFQRVLPAQIRYLVHKIVDVVGSHQLGEVMKTTQLGEAANSDVWQSAEGGKHSRREAVVDLIADPHVRGDNGEVIARVTDPQVVGPLRARSPGVVSSDSLRPRMNHCAIFGE